MSDYPFRNLVFEGGGVKGIAYVGALEILEKKGILQNIDRIGGTSAGAINAVLLAAGYTRTQMLKEMSTLNFRDFMDDSWGVLRDSRRLFNEYGWFKGDFFRDWIGDLLAKQGLSRDITFKALEQKTGKKLYLYTTNLSTSFGEVFSAEHTPRTRVVDATRRSMSFPLFFRAVLDDRGDTFVDGGALNNYPVKLFDRKKYLDADGTTAPNHFTTPEYYKKENKKRQAAAHTSSSYVYNKETLGFRLDSSANREIGPFRDGDEPVHNPIDNLLEFTIELLKTMLNAQENQHLHSDDWHRTIYIDTEDISPLDFDLSEESKKTLLKNGKAATKKYFEWWEDTSEDLAKNHPAHTG